jgi:uncharacterized protein YggU (UPF0235/DUF167 family)
MRIKLKVRPKSSKISLRLLDDDPILLEVSVLEAPVDGKATKAAIAMIATAAGIAPSRISLVSGSRSRYKIIDISADDEPKWQEFVRTLLG